jgi:hypothetical protein
MQDRNEMLSILLTVRAGLSIVSREKYKAGKIIEFTQDINCELLEHARRKEKLYNLEFSDYITQTNVWAQQNETAAVKHALFHIFTGLTLIDAIQSTFDGFIKKDNWTDIDGAIYYLKSGKADSINSALKLATDVDTQLNESAAEEVTDFLCGDLKYLQSDIKKYTQILSEQMISLSKINSNYMGMDNFEYIPSKGHLDAKKQYISELITLKGINNALLDKSQISSYDLFEDVQELKTKANYSQIKTKLAVK